MSATHQLPVLMPNVPNQRWSCHSCSNCCRTLVVHLLDDERERLKEEGWAEKLGVTPYVRVGRGYALNKHSDGACVFLDDDNRCRIHAKLGPDAKPLACRLFPFSVRPVPGAWQASLRFDCPSVVESKGAPIRQHRPAVRSLAAGMSSVSPDVAVELQRGVRATDDETTAVQTRLIRFLKNEDLPMTQRLFGAARVTATLDQATLAQVRGERFSDLLDVLFQTLPVESAVMPGAATPRSRGMLRQLAFAHAEHVTLHEQRSTRTRFRRRWQQWRSAGRFRVGRGLVPTLPGFARDVRFEAVETIEPNSDDGRRVEELVLRYLIVRLEARSVFGAGYYGWAVVTGLAALWLSVAATGWLARYVAATEGRSTLGFNDIGRALGMVDRAATRLPALGTVSERARIAYLIRDDGMARLLSDFNLVDVS